MTAHSAKQASPPQSSGQGPHDARTLQSEASHPETSVWVRASAGSGKTTVLTGRVLRLMLESDRALPERILCLTYTRAAAAEMTLRLMQRLGFWATCSDDALRQDLDALQNCAPKPKQLTRARRLFATVLACPGGLRIHTLHAFCQEILRRFPIEAGLAPYFSVIEETDRAALEEDALNSLFKECRDHPHSPLGQALHALGSHLGEDKLLQALRSIQNERARLKNALHEAGGLPPFLETLRQEAGIAKNLTREFVIKEACRFCPEAELNQAALQLMEGLKKASKKGQDLKNWLSGSAEDRARNFLDYCRIFLTNDGDPFKSFADKELAARYPDLHLFLNAEAERLEIVKRTLDTLDVIERSEQLLLFGTALSARIEERKKSSALLDYNDLISLTAALLERPGIAPWILYKLDGGLDHILVDEAQDTSGAQWKIIAHLAEEFFVGETRRSNIKRTLFVVGDEKQSIFSFQGADPEAFSTMRQFFAERLHNAGSLLKEQAMSMSFRSAPAILKAVDAVFKAPEVRQGVATTPIEHRAYYKDKMGHVELWPLLQAPLKETSSDPWLLPLAFEDETDPEAHLADIIAEKIQAWLSSAYTLPGDTKPLSASDIMILLRRRGRMADLLVRALKKRNVPVTGVDRMRLIKQLPVMDLLALMQFALLPEDDLTLATVLRGPLLGLSEEDLMALALHREGSLWHSLLAHEKKRPHFQKAAHYLKECLARADYSTPFNFLAHALYGLSADGLQSGRHALWHRLGPDALDPIQELLTSAEDFSTRHSPSLQAFLHWLTMADSEVKRELDKGGEQVRIMTVHAAKGLEAPVVFLPDAASIPQPRDIPNLLWFKNCPYFFQRKVSHGFLGRLWEEARTKQLEEYRRLLYVGMTRAEKVLYIAGVEKTRKKNKTENEIENLQNYSWHKLVAKALPPLEPSSLLTEETNTPNSLMPLAILSDRHDTPRSLVSTPSRAHLQSSPLPLWARTKAPEEDAPSKNLIPSQQDVAPAGPLPDTLFARGRLLHRLFQSLPDIEDSLREKAGLQYLRVAARGLPERDRQNLINEVLHILRNPQNQSLFGPKSRAEVSILGRLGDQRLPGRVDRLLVEKDLVTILDYKTNRIIPKNIDQVPHTYLQQMAAYKTVLAAIYPRKKIACFLLWTCLPELMEIPADIIDNVALST